MTSPADRRRAAAEHVGKIADTLRAEGRGRDGGYLTPFLGMRKVLADPEFTDEDALTEVRDWVADLYRGGRNFSDYYIQRADGEELRRVNREFEAEIDALKAAVGYQ